MKKLNKVLAILCTSAIAVSGVAASQPAEATAVTTITLI